MCREQEVTRLIRVDVSTSSNGVLTVTLSEQGKGFAPYRLDNCTGLKLHLRLALHLHSPADDYCCWSMVILLSRGSCNHCESVC